MNRYWKADSLVRKSKHWDIDSHLQWIYFMWKAPAELQIYVWMSSISYAVNHKPMHNRGAQDKWDRIVGL